MISSVSRIVLCALLIQTVSAKRHRGSSSNINKVPVPETLKDVKWLIGKWRSEFGGKLVWPTVPTLTYGEEIEFRLAPISYTAAGLFLNYSSRAWSHSTKDHFLDSYGYLSQDDKDGNVTFLTIGNNGFTTIESGKSKKGLMTLGLKEIGRIAIARDLPVEDLYRQFKLVKRHVLEQVLLMRTATHPADKGQLLEHSRIVYKKVNERPPTTKATTPAAFVTQVSGAPQQQQKESSPGQPADASQSAASITTTSAPIQKQISTTTPSKSNQQKAEGTTLDANLRKILQSENDATNILL